MFTWASGGDIGGAEAAMGPERAPATTTAARTGHLEDEAVCGLWRERLLSALYHFLAGRPDPTRVAGIPGIERVDFVTKDNRRLGGYLLRAYADPTQPARGYVLVALGNAMLADQVVGAFRFLQADGFDVHVYDYRGYGLSAGRSRLAAVISDHVELIAHLNGAGYDPALIDSPPSRIADYGCPRRPDPVENGPADATRLGFVFGQRDSVVPPAAWRDLAETGRARGAFVLERADFAHPMMDADPTVRQARFDAIRTFFADRVR
jgi:hypothetical protein